MNSKDLRSLLLTNIHHKTKRNTANIEEKKTGERGKKKEGDRGKTELKRGRRRLGGKNEPESVATTTTT